MNRRDFMSKVLLGVAVTPAAVKAVTELAPVDSSYTCVMQYQGNLVGIYAQLKEAGRIADVGPGPSDHLDLQKLTERLYSMKREREADGDPDTIEFVIRPDPETMANLQELFGPRMKVFT